MEVSATPQYRTLSRLSQFTLLLLLACLGSLTSSRAIATVTVGDAELMVAFYNDSSCLLTIDKKPRIGHTTVDVDVDDNGSRMLIHCDTEDARRLTILARGDSLNVNERVELLSHEEIDREATGVTCWLTGSGVHYTDDSVPRRYVIHGSVMLRATPATDEQSDPVNGNRQAFGSLTGLLEELIKPQDEAPNVLPQDDTEDSTTK